ncbi:4'-phosphopantetheinyl transferase [Fulvimarina endophytica]|uniref:4'-phosphopantetheinyl transferase n=1 Tax=Fulvimarina endophytica TaxID=2293836 RepID=A0A371X768_9HYPH|nr:4'-phosphopantetheinyl transferase superfamily protein [Fulvimarina endophytica]RFC65082.1 4'-phosphopantetheinyl transferase [Fulvimarina endophytica]
MPEPLALRSAGKDVRIHLTPLDRVPPETRQAYVGLLDPAEASRHDRFKVEGARLEFLVGRALLRLRLTACRPEIAPTDWRFTSNAYGRPAIDWPSTGAEASPLFFNLSHTRGLVALAVAACEDIGVDVETIARGAPDADVARRYFTATEADWIDDAQELSERTERFFALWTLKEAYIKARGMGLALPLDGFGFDCSRRPPEIAFTQKIDDHASRWRLERRCIGDGHRLALAVPSALKASRYFETIPLVAGPREIRPRVCEAFA